VNNSYVEIKEKLEWNSVLSTVVDNDVFLLNKGKGDFILGFGTTDSISLKTEDYDAEKIQFFIDAHPHEYLFATISYDIKNDETRQLKHQKQEQSYINFSAVANVFITKNNSTYYFGQLNTNEANELTNNLKKVNVLHPQSETIKLNPSTSKASYLNTVKQIKDKIQNGIIYEMNYCVDFNGVYERINITQTYEKLVQQTNAPFSAFIRHGNQFILSASPERFLLKKDDQLLSQPIKGTAKRGQTTEQDVQIASELTQDQKEIAENVMIVDLVRNDLSKLATKKSVKVTELCKLYTFETVHQLISTITCQLKENNNFTTILQALFPMGSMTGAPKISAIEQINTFETFQRGIYSGSLGYFDPNGNFDLNVVIRSILIDDDIKKINCRVGGAITIHSVPEKEYNECLLKLKALESSLC